MILKKIFGKIVNGLSDMLMDLLIVVSTITVLARLRGKNNFVVGATLVIMIFLTVLLMTIARCTHLVNKKFYQQQMNKYF
jgi:hypothetical protein